MKNNKSNHPTFLIVDLPFHNVTHKGELTIVLGAVNDSVKPFSLFVIGHSPISPMQYPKETFELVYALLNRFEIAFEDVSVYLDYEKFNGVSKSNLSRWKVTHYNEKFLDDSLEDMIHNRLSKEEKGIRDKYYLNMVYNNSIDPELHNYKRNNLY